MVDQRKKSCRFFQSTAHAEREKSFDSFTPGSLGGTPESRKLGMVITRKLGQEALTTWTNRPIQILQAFRHAFSKFRCIWRMALLRRPPWHIASSIARRAIPVAISSSSRSSIQPLHQSNRAEPSPENQSEDVPINPKARSPTSAWIERRP